MEILVVGSVGLDTITTPHGTREDVIGGSASHFSVSASYYAKTNMVAVVGEDFPQKPRDLFKRRGVDTKGLQTVAGRTFRWSGYYNIDYHKAYTLETQLNGGLSSIRFSQIVSYDAEKVVIVDSVGILVSLYQYAHIVYVGGGFGEGVHNVLEPAVYGVPVLIGPNHGNSHEAMELIKREGLIAVEDAAGLSAQLERLLADYREAAGEERDEAEEALLDFFLDIDED